MRIAVVAGPGLICAIGLLAGGCATAPRATHGVIVVEKEGPPPHAPAHGYRYRHWGGPDLVYDSRLQVYRVAGRPDSYYNDGVYYRLAGSSWERSGDFERGWKKASTSSLPPGLRKESAGEPSKKEMQAGRGADDDHHHHNAPHPPGKLSPAR